jgi:hypothetical protein
MAMLKACCRPCLDFIVPHLLLMDFDQFRRYLPVLLLVSLLAVMVLYVVIRVKIYRRREARRLVALARVAAELGMGFTPEERTILHQLGGITLAPPVEPTTRATSVMRGTVRGSPVVLFDYHVTYSVGNNRSSMELTIAAFDFTSAPIPVFDAEGQQRWARRLINKALADKVVDFPDDPDFKRYFNVTGNDAPAVRRLLSPEVRSFLKQHRSEWIFRSNGRCLVMYRSPKRLKPEDYGAFAEEASEVMRVITR